MKTLLAILVFSLLAVAQQTRQERIVICTDAGASDTYACTPAPAVTSYTTNLKVRLYAPTANTGAATVNISALGAKAIMKQAGGITTALADNDIRAGQYVELIYDGTNFQMLSQLGNAAAGGGGTVYGSAAGLGRYIPFVLAGTTSVGASTSLLVRYIQFTLPAAAIFNTYTYSCGAAATNNCGGGTDPCGVTFALYDSAGNIVTNSISAGAAPTSSGAKSVAMAGNATLAAGSYYFAWATNSTAFALGGTAAGLFGSAYVNLGLGATTYHMFEDSSARATGTGNPVTMPSTIDSTRVAWAPTNMPALFFTRQ